MFEPSLSHPKQPTKKPYQPPSIPVYCKTCGTPFFARLKSADYCSTTCRVKYHRLTSKPKVCSKPRALPEFIPPPRVTCACCNALFFANKNNTKLYCGNACKQAAYRARTAAGVDYLGRPIKRGIAGLPAQDNSIYRELFELALA